MFPFDVKCVYQRKTRSFWKEIEKPKLEMGEGRHFQRTVLILSPFPVASQQKRKRKLSFFIEGNKARKEVRKWRQMAVILVHQHK